DQFDVPHSSHGRKKKGAKAHDLNVKDAWRRRAPSNAKAKRAYHFSDIISQTAACQLAKGKVDKHDVGHDSDSNTAKQTRPSVKVPYMSNLKLEFN
ncbi:unnamed protein product, partial [Rotaria magnacalcarata]